MGSTVVIYKSKYGFTKKYAEWIAQELDADIKEAAQTKPADLKSYDVIIYGGGLYAGGVSGISLLTKSFNIIKDKSLYLFTVGAADVTDEKNISNIQTGLQKVLSPEMQKQIKIFHFRGGIDYLKLNFVHRTMMVMLLNMLKKKPESELLSEDKLMIETYGQTVDFSDRSTITPLVQAIKENNKL